MGFHVQLLLTCTACKLHCLCLTGFPFFVLFRVYWRQHDIHKPRMGIWRSAIAYSVYGRDSLISQRLPSSIEERLFLWHMVVHVDIARPSRRQFSRTKTAPLSAGITLLPGLAAGANGGGKHFCCVATRALWGWGGQDLIGSRSTGSKITARSGPKCILVPG